MPSNRIFCCEFNFFRLLFFALIEVHLSDENSNKECMNNILCLLEARLEGRKPMAVSGAIDKLKSALETIIRRINNIMRIENLMVPIFL